MARKIAIIEDNLGLAHLYALRLEAEGYLVAIAENGKLGLTLCEEMQPDLALVDLMMPEMSGDEMLAKMRRAEWGKHIKVIILTNVGEQEAPSRLKDLDVSGFVLKSEMTPSEVADIIKRELEG